MEPAMKLKITDNYSLLSFDADLLNFPPSSRTFIRAALKKFSRNTDGTYSILLSIRLGNKRLASKLYISGDKDAIEEVSDAFYKIIAKIAKNEGIRRRE